LKVKAPKNRTLEISEQEIENYSKLVLNLTSKVRVKDIKNKIINQDLFEAVDFLPRRFVDLLFIDPPYNLSKSFNSNSFKEKSIEEYSKWIESFVIKLKRILKPNASIYFCGDWKSSTSIHFILDKHFKVRNRITWEREKGRGAKTNWKNNSEDIWFATMSDEYVFNVDDVKLKRKVIAPYRNDNGDPKDWNMVGEYGFRLTFPSNIWNDISVPFWSMKENTFHPTQKSEKLMAKIILASSNKNQMVFDPFAGSGSTMVAAKKLKRNFVGIELDKVFACLAQKRIELAEKEKCIQGYDGKVFWERNTFQYFNNGRK
jgi:site-specific DNA-methyltransferase (adenine-specific)